MLGALTALSSFIPRCVSSGTFPSLDIIDSIIILVLQTVDALRKRDFLHFNILQVNWKLSTGMLCDISEVEKIPVSYDTMCFQKTEGSVSRTKIGTSNFYKNMISNDNIGNHTSLLYNFLSLQCSLYRKLFGILIRMRTYWCVVCVL